MKKTYPISYTCPKCKRVYPWTQAPIEDPCDDCWAKKHGIEVKIYPRARKRATKK